VNKCALALAMVSAVSAVSSCAGTAAAQYRLRADAFYTASDTTSGFVMLTSEARYPSWLYAEAVMWLGTGDYHGDVMVASVRAREPHGYGEVRAGRMLVATGALRPVHLDGVDATARAPWGTSIEVFGGSPVAPQYEPRDYDWAVGGRMAQKLSTYGTVGLSYLQMRKDGEVSYEELGVDALATPFRWLDAAFAGTVDLQSLGLGDARLSLASRFGGVRLELFAVQRSPSHLLPANSLFSALGDVPSQRAGAALLWRAAPRLDVLGEGAAESLGGELGVHALLRATLRLDDRGESALGIEGRREDIPFAGAVGSSASPTESWTGVRGTARVPMNRFLSAAAEVEVVVPDDARGRGRVWPWGLLALRFKPEPRWEMAGAVEASSSPTALSSVSGLVRVSYVWGKP
jgi:hypothetical protein